MNATVQNAGNADAEGVIVIGVVEDDDGAVTEGKGQAELIPVGESRTVEVFLNLPADEHDIRLRVTTASLEADVHDNEGLIEADVAYVEIGYDYIFTPGGYWSDGSANVEVAVSAYNSGVAAFVDTAEMSYSCAGADIDDDVSTGKFEFTMPDGFSTATHSVTLRSSPGTLECSFISQEQGSETHEFNIADKILGVSREVWECYRDSEINRQDDIGCAGREEKSVVKWDLDRPLRIWATGDPDYIDVLWATLDRLLPIFDMTFTSVQSEGDADLKAWVGITRDEGPEHLRSGKCVDAAGCAYRNWSTDYVAYDASIGVWTVEADWLHRAGLVDRHIEHVTLHELLHALMPMGHRDDPLSAVNNINAPDWITLDPLEEALIRLHRNRLIRPGMAMEEVRELIVLENELLDPPDGRVESPTPIEILREAFRTLQNADSASWHLKGGWSGDCSEFRFGLADYTIAGFNSLGPEVTGFIHGSTRIFYSSDEDWLDRDGLWVKDAPDIWEKTEWWPGWGNPHVMLVSALYFASDDDVRAAMTNLDETTLRFTLNNTTLSKGDWYRSLTLTARVTVDDRTLEITAYEMDWHFDTVSSDSSDRYEVRASQGEYGVRIDVPDVVYFGTTDDMREAIDRVNGPR